MTAAVGRPFRLSLTAVDALARPPFGACTNGLPACSWVPLLDAFPPFSRELLSALRERRIAACAGAPGARWRRQERKVDRVWVDVVDRARAEDVLRHVVNQLDGKGGVERCAAPVA